MVKASKNNTNIFSYDFKINFYNEKKEEEEGEDKDFNCQIGIDSKKR